MWADLGIATAAVTAYIITAWIIIGFLKGTK